MRWPIIRKRILHVLLALGFFYILCQIYWFLQSFERPGTEKEKIINWLTHRYSFKFYEEVDDAWTLAKSWFSEKSIIPDKVSNLGAVLSALSTVRVVAADCAPKGSQLKLLLTLDGGQRAYFKPKWYGRDERIGGAPYEGRDRHNGEVATFHVNRLLGLNRAPLSVGRVLHFSREIAASATECLRATFFERRGSRCFYGKCIYCRGPDDGVCADGELLEGAVILHLPEALQRKRVHHPWARTYARGRLARWEMQDKFCQETMNNEIYKDGSRRLLDILDIAVLDYLTGNADRHHYELFNHTESMIVILDNGKTFGHPYRDEKSILAPLVQCCRLRAVTWERLEALAGGVLGHALAAVLQDDPIRPVLSTEHLSSLDRRLKHIASTVHKCFRRYGRANVLVGTSVRRQEILV